MPPALGGDSGSVTFILFHFSDHGGFTGSEVDPLVVIDAPSDFLPSEWEAQLDHLLSELMANERTSQTLGEEGNPDLETQVEANLNTFFVKVIAPMLVRIAGQCAYYEANAGKVLAWIRTVELVGLGQTFTSEIGRAEDAVRTGAHNCWEEAIEPCIDPAAPSYARVLQMARLNLLLGGSTAVYDPAREDLACDDQCQWLDDVTAIDVTYSFDWQVSGEVFNGSASLARSWEATGTLVPVVFPENPTTVFFSGDSELGEDITASFEIAEERLVNEPRTVTISESGAAPPSRVDVFINVSKVICTHGANFRLDALDVATVDSITGTAVDDLWVSTATLVQYPLGSGTIQESLTLETSVPAGTPLPYGRFYGGPTFAMTSLNIAENLGTADVSHVPDRAVSGRA